MRGQKVSVECVNKDSGRDPNGDDHDLLAYGFAVFHKRQVNLQFGYQSSGHMLSISDADRKPRKQQILYQRLFNLLYIDRLFL